MNHPEQFIEPDIDHLYQSRNDIFENINRVVDVANDCFHNFRKCRFPEDLPSINLKLPKRIPGVFWKDICEFKEHSICGDHTYKEASSPSCGVKQYKLGRGEACGIEQYKLGRSSECGVEAYNQGTSEVCGTETGYLKQEYDPGYRNCLPGRDNVSAEVSVNQGLYANFFPERDWHNCSHQNGGVRGGQPRWSGQSICQNRHSGHWWIICRGQVPKTCRHPNFGVERYNICRAEANGVESYLSCRNEVFGVESYLTCRHKDHGIDKYQACYVPKEEKNIGFDCSKDPQDYQ